MKKKIFSILVILLACGVLLAPAISQAKIGVIMHDHGAPGVYDKTTAPGLTHDDNSYYGIKLFLRHLIMMKVIPSIVFCGDAGNDLTQCDNSTLYATEDYDLSFYPIENKPVCVGGSDDGLSCYRNSHCSGGTCKIENLNLIDDISTAIGLGGSASLTDPDYDFSTTYKDGTYVVLSGFQSGPWWGFIGAGGANDTIEVYNDPGLTTRGWCYADPNSGTKRYWIRKDPTPLMDAWGDDPTTAGEDYKDLYFYNTDGNYDEHFRLNFAGPGYLNPPAGPDKNFDEYGGLDFYYNWQEMGGYEPYFFQIYPQMTNVRDSIWTTYQALLQDGDADPKEDLIRLTQGIDYQFSDDPTEGQCVEMVMGMPMPTGESCLDNGDCTIGTSPTCDMDRSPRHGQSLYDAVINLIDPVNGPGVDKIIIAEHFVGHSRMMNEDMGRITAQHALDASADPSTPIIYAPDRILIGEVDYARVDAVYFEPDPVTVGGQYDFSTKWKGPAYVAGTFFNDTLANCIVDKAVSEINTIIFDGADNIAVLLSGHGTSNTNSGAYDSISDTPHFNTKVWFINSVRKIVFDLGGTPASVVFGPDSVADSEVNYAGWYKDLKADGSSGMDIIGRDIQYATITGLGGRDYKFYRCYGQNAYTEQGVVGDMNDDCLKEDPNQTAQPSCGPDPYDKVFSPREALLDLVDLNSEGDPDYTDVLDLLVAFFGDSQDLLVNHRYEGYGENLGYCDATASGADTTRCADQKALYELANHFPNPAIHDTSDIHWAGRGEYSGLACNEGTGTPSYDPATWVAGQGVYDETHQADCYRSNFTYNSIDVHITNGTYCFPEKETAVYENISAALDDATADNVLGDGDGIIWDDDNCSTVSNPNQEDGDCDGTGDACDESNDCDGIYDPCDDDCDGIPNDGGDHICADGETTNCDDNCRYVWNPSQANNDDAYDDTGNACDDNTDNDNDGYGDPWAYENTCSNLWMGNMMPMMGMEMCDNCPDTYNCNQKDSDRDGLGDCCDPSQGCDGDGEPTCDPICGTVDLDKDCVLDTEDNCPDDYNPGQEDNYPPDGNDCGDACECKGDFNFNGTIPGAELGQFAVDFGRQDCADNSCKGDFNCDGMVTGAELGQFAVDFGREDCPICPTDPWCVY